MNVLSRGKVPNVLSLRDVLRQWLDHRKVVLVRRSRFRLGKIAERLEVLGGYLIAYLNLDEVIRIIREEDEPKAVMMKRFKLTEAQVEAILNMRLRQLRKLDEIEIRQEFDALKAEKKDLEALLKSDERQWKCVAFEIEEVKKTFGQDTPLGKRRTGFADAPEIDVEEMQEAMIEREPVTVVLSEKGWIRAMRGHLADLGTLTFKEGDRLKRAFHATTMDKVLILSTGGKVFTLEAAKLPGGRGHGEPVRLMLDMDKDQDVVAIFPFDPSGKLVVASRRRLRVPRRGERACRQHAQGQAGAERLRHRRGEDLRAGGGRPDRGRRHQPQDDHLPARAASGDGARQGRAPAALQGRRAFRRARLREGRGAELDRFAPAASTRARRRAQGLDRRARAGRPAVAAGLSEDRTSSETAT